MGLSSVDQVVVKVLNYRAELLNWTIYLLEHWIELLEFAYWFKLNQFIGFNLLYTDIGHLITSCI